MIIPSSKEMFIKSLDSTFSRSDTYSEITRLDTEEATVQADPTNRFEVACKEADKLYSIIQTNLMLAKASSMIIPLGESTGAGAYAAQSIKIIGPIGVGFFALCGVVHGFALARIVFFPEYEKNAKIFVESINNILALNGVHEYRLDRIKSKIDVLTRATPVLDKDKAQKTKAIDLLQSNLIKITGRNIEIFSQVLVPSELLITRFHPSEYASSKRGMKAFCKKIREVGLRDRSSDVSAPVVKLSKEEWAIVAARELSSIQAVQTTTVGPVLHHRLTPSTARDFSTPLRTEPYLEQEPKPSVVFVPREHKKKE